MKNKEIIDKLTAYYLKQDPKVVGRVLASLQLDLYRLSIFEFLSEQEQDCLMARCEHNNKEFRKLTVEPSCMNVNMGFENVQNWFEVPSEGDSCDSI